jgi:hypothetical protein
MMQQQWITAFSAVCPHVIPGSPPILCDGSCQSMPLNTGWKAHVEASTEIMQHLGGAVQKASSRSSVDHRLKIGYFSRI